MKIALVGSSGYIAEYVLKKFETNCEIESILKLDKTPEADEFLDLREAEKFDYERLSNIDYIVFMAAVSGPDKCAEEFDDCWKINVTGTNLFIRQAIKKGCKVLFFSSDAVFGDIPGEVYTEMSETQACTPYGCMKKAVEDEFKGEPLFKAIRLSYVASMKDRFISYCLKCLQNEEIADIFHPFYRNVIVVSDVVAVVDFFANHWEEYEPTFLNVAGKELVSRVRIVDELNRHLGGKLKYTISRPKEEFFKNRPCITQMQSLYLNKYDIISDSTFTEKIRKILEDINDV